MKKIVDPIITFTRSAMPYGWSRITNPQNYIDQFKQYVVGIVASYIVTAKFLTLNPFSILGTLLDKFNTITENYYAKFPSVLPDPHHQQLLAIVIIFAVGKLLLLSHACLEAKTGKVINFIKLIIMGTSKKISNVVELILILGLLILMHHQNWQAVIYTILIIFLVMFINILLTGKPATTN